MLASRLNTAVVLAGQGVELKVITAVVLGGASLSGGVGTISGAFLGVLFMALLQNAMIIAGINPFWQLIVVGIVLLVSVGLDQFVRNARSRLTFATARALGRFAGVGTSGRWKGRESTRSDRDERRSAHACLSRSWLSRSAAAARAQGPTGLDVPIGDPAAATRSMSGSATPRTCRCSSSGSIPGLESARKALNVKVRIAGPTSVDLGAFITTVDTECTKNPAGVIVVGGWDDALASEVDKCIEKKVPTVVTDGDLPMSKRLTYLGTNWYNLGYQHGQYQCRYHAEAGLEAGEIGTISFLAASNFIQARQGLRDALAKECPGVTVVADEEIRHQRRAGRRQHRGDHPGPPQPDRHGGLRFRSRPGHRPRRHRGRQGRPDHRHLQRGRP